MSVCRVIFYPQNKKVTVKKSTSLLDAVSKAHISINNLCGGDGICGRCKMVVKEGEVAAEVSPKLTREEIKNGVVLACMTRVEGDLVIQIPEETLAKEKISADLDAERFKDFEQTILLEEFEPTPLVRKVYLELEPPTLVNNTADHERLCEALCKKIGDCETQMGLKIIKSLPSILRRNKFQVTATVGLRGHVAEIMNVEGGNTADKNYMVIVDMGTTTVVAHLVDAISLKTIDAKACFNSQGIYGREVTRRMIHAERRGSGELQKLIIRDINRLITTLANANGINLKDITAVVCAGNPAMGHFLLGLPTPNIRRYPYVANTVHPPPLRAAQVGIEINPRALLYSLPGISAWVGSDITAGILATKIHERDDITLLVDIGTNGETVIGSKEWIVAASASAGPALEGASVACGMRAARGAVESVYIEDGEIKYSTIGNGTPKGICGSGIIDIVSVLLKKNIIDRSGLFIESSSDRIMSENGLKRFILVPEDKEKNLKPVYITESDIENVITAKAAIFAAIKILTMRLDLNFEDIERVYLAGAFGKRIDIDNAITIGLIPSIPKIKIQFVGNTSIRGAKIVAFYQQAFYKIAEIRNSTTYYDLMGADDYVEEFKKALFLPHTDIEQFQPIK
ncbi:MAG: DUF4445 domain-containing protein [Spirochaetota bacterium]|nr:MAG: DUF4445 domain-containing protein [Spirochaetota bacterium]